MSINNTGVPGRAGADGIPGKAGKDGVHGMDGKNGIHGKDGSPGPIGPPGQMGSQGLRGNSSIFIYIYFPSPIFFSSRFDNKLIYPCQRIKDSVFLFPSSCKLKIKNHFYAFFATPKSMQY